MIDNWTNLLVTFEAFDLSLNDHHGFKNKIKLKHVDRRITQRSYETYALAKLGHYPLNIYANN